MGTIDRADLHRQIDLLAPELLDVVEWEPLRTKRSRSAHEHAMFRSRLLGLVYLIVGVAIAASHHYFEHLNTIRLIASAVLAILLWPLLLLGIDLHIKK